MMGIDDAFIGFIISYLAGSLPSLKDVFLKKNNETLQERLDKSFEKALEKWCADDALRRRIAHQRFTSVVQLKEFASSIDSDESMITIKSLVDLWVKELVKDEECAHYIQEQTLSGIDDKLNKLTELITKLDENNKLQLKPRGRKTHKPVENYIRRYCSSKQSENDFVAYLLENKERKCLADFVIGLVEPEENKYVLYSSAQTGKTTELNQLCWELQQSGLYLPISFEVRTNTALNRDQLPDFRFYNGKEIVVIIDALDEVNGKKYDDLMEEIGGYAYDHPEMKMVLSCRSNFRRVKQMDIFKEVYLQELSYGDAKDHAFQELGKGKGQDFAKFIVENELSKFVRNPFFLNVLIDAYKDGVELPKTKAAIYRLFIEKSYRIEKEQKSVLLAKQHSFEESLQFFERVALAMSLMNLQSLSDDELKSCLWGNDEIVTECLRYDLIQCENGIYSFQHNAFREWLVADYLSRQGLQKAKELATHPNGRLKPEWYNIILLWISMFGADKKQGIDAVLSWLKESSLELIIYFDKGIVDDKTKDEVFKGVLLEYKSLGIRMSNIMTQDYSNLLSFCHSDEAIGFIADELIEAKQHTAYYADLMCLCYFLDWELLSKQNEVLTERLFSVLEQKTKESLGKNISNDLSFLYFDNNFFTRKKHLDRIFDIIGNSDHYEAIRSMVRLIAAAERVDEFVDYILEKEKFVHNQKEGNTTYIVTRTSIFVALAKVKSLESIKKILAHQFSHSYVAYHDEQEEYWKMLEAIIGQTDEYIRKGNVEIINELLTYYLNLYKDFNYYFDRDKRPQEILRLLRKCYQDAGLSEQGKKEFYEQQQLLFNPSNGSTDVIGSVRKLYLMAALWITVDEVAEDFNKFNLNDGVDMAKANWYREIPYIEVAETAARLYEEKYPGQATNTIGYERRLKALDDFADYQVFKQLVLEMATGLDEHTSRKDHVRKLRELDEGFNQYAYRFFLCYSSGEDSYDIEGIVKGIKEKDVYDAFFMREIANLIEHPVPELTVADEILKRCVDCAKQTVIRLCRKECPTFFGEVAMKLMLNDYFDVPVELLPELIPYGNLNVTKKFDDGYYNTEYSLFEYITERVDAITLAPIIIEKLRQNVNKEWFRMSYRFSNYIIENRIEEGYELALQFATTGFYLSGNILESLIANRIKIDEIKAIASRMKDYDRINCYSILVKNGVDENWVKEQLEPVFRQFDGFNLKLALGLLLSIGSLDALGFLLTHPEFMKDGLNYNFVYDNPNATPLLCDLIQYNYENKIEDGPFVLTSILASLERIALKDNDSFKEVIQSMRKLTQKGEQYKYLNRYIISFEDKYYAGFYGIGDIKEVIKMIDSSGAIQKAVEVSEEAVQWKDNEGVYVSYNWESSSFHIVDYLCTVLEDKGIPYKRDKKDCHYLDNIKGFMNSISAGNTVIVVFSKPYLKSKNCMYELTGILEDPCYKDRILPVVVDDTIRDSLFYVELVKHWKDERDKQKNLVKEIRKIDPKMAKPEKVRLAEINKVYDFLMVIKDYIDWTNADNLDYLSSTRFGTIVRHILERKR
ncbi:MAG: toll/interleukin-1 receptor domain-containing protein [Bacteroidales bacterium]|nr:toll/interleukin-1 receptor domain-containing protein [Bacteroidales bacterium]